MSFLNIQKKVKTKLPGEDSVPEGEELGAGKIYGDKPVRDSELPCNTKPNVSDGVPGAGVDIGAKIISESETITENRQSTPRTEQIPPVQEDVASHSLEKKDKDVRIMEKEQLPSSKVQRYFLWRYSWYLNRFQESLKQEMPDTFKMFHIFTVGVKEFVIDFRYIILGISCNKISEILYHNKEIHLLMILCRLDNEIQIFPQRFHQSAHNPESTRVQSQVPNTP